MNYRQYRNRRAARRMLPSQTQSWDLYALTNNLPGGIMSCDASPELNLIQYSDGFLRLFGYTRAEIATRFHDRFAEMIWPEDLPIARASAQAQLAEGNSKQIEYRIQHRDGHLVSILDRGQLMPGNPPQFCCILLDVTESKRVMEALRLSLERYQIIMDQTTDIIFEWDVVRDTLVFSPIWRKTFGYEPICENISTDIFGEASHIHPDDRESLRQYMHMLQAHMQYGEIEFRMQTLSGEYLWLRARVTPQLDSQGKFAKAIGVLVNIDAEKRTTQHLLERAERDTLTGLYNKGTAQALAERYIANAVARHPCAYMIIDVDNFKAVNDNYGHLSGDVLLSDIATTLQKMFRSQDVLGRIGGDEFAVLMRDVADTNVVTAKAQEILLAFSHLMGAMQAPCHLSCSIGISLAPADGTDFQTIYQKADIALYHAKTTGKNRFALYDPARHALGMPVGERNTTVSNQIDSEHISTNIKAQLSEYVFHVLYQSEDIMTAIPLILEIVGRQFDVSRVYVFENSPDGAYCKNTYEWCNSDCASQQENLQHVCYAEHGDYLSLFDENGVLYCRNVSTLPPGPRAILEMQDIKSVLQCQIRDNGQFRGFVGFDECRVNRFWTQEQINALSMIAEIISIFLLKSRAQSHTVEMLQNLTSILDHQDSWIYAIEAGTYRVLYANRKMQELLPTLALGDCCYEKFFGESAPCAVCPIAHMGSETCSELEMFSRVTGSNIRVRTVLMPWSGQQQVYLISCTGL